eukprot:Opistho-2@23440
MLPAIFRRCTVNDGRLLWLVFGAFAVFALSAGPSALAASADAIGLNVITNLTALTTAQVAHMSLVAGASGGDAENARAMFSRSPSCYYDPLVSKPGAMPSPGTDCALYPAAIDVVRADPSMGGLGISSDRINAWLGNSNPLSLNGNFVRLANTTRPTTHPHCRRLARLVISWGGQISPPLSMATNLTCMRAGPPMRRPSTTPCTSRASAGMPTCLTSTPRAAPTRIYPRRCAFGRAC